MVDDVGAKSRGQASFLDFICILISANCPIADLLLLVNETISFACLFNEECIFIISSVSPELEISITISFLFINPMSPWAASVG